MSASGNGETDGSKKKKIVFFDPTEIAGGSDANKTIIDKDDLLKFQKMVSTPEGKKRGRPKGSKNKNPRKTPKPGIPWQDADSGDEKRSRSNFNDASDDEYFAQLEQQIAQEALEEKRERQRMLREKAMSKAMSSGRGRGRGRGRPPASSYTVRDMYGDRVTKRRSGHSTYGQLPACDENQKIIRTTHDFVDQNLLDELVGMPGENSSSAFEVPLPPSPSVLDRPDASSVAVDECPSQQLPEDNVGRIMDVVKSRRRAPPLQLPKSSADLACPSEHLLDFLAIYEPIRLYSRLLRISPILFEDFCYALLAEDESTLLSELHIVLLRALLREDDAAGTLMTIPDSKDSTNLLFLFVDRLTWPHLLSQYLDSIRRAEPAASAVVRTLQASVAATTAASNPSGCNVAGGADKVLSASLFPPGVLPLDANYPRVPVTYRVQVLQGLVNMFIATGPVRAEVLRVGAPPHEDHCRICHLSGEVLCCDGCTGVYHLGCFDPPMTAVPESTWLCPVCVKNATPGVTDCISPTERAGQACRPLPIGVDRAGHIYWYMARRLLVETVDFAQREVELPGLSEGVRDDWEAEAMQAALGRRETSRNDADDDDEEGRDEERHYSAESTSCEEDEGAPKPRHRPGPKSRRRQKRFYEHQCNPIIAYCDEPKAYYYSSVAEVQRVRACLSPKWEAQLCAKLDQLLATRMPKEMAITAKLTQEAYSTFHGQLKQAKISYVTFPVLTYYSRLLHEGEEENEDEDEPNVDDSRCKELKLAFTMPWLGREHLAEYHKSYLSTKVISDDLDSSNQLNESDRTEADDVTAIEMDENHPCFLIEDLGKGVLKSRNQNGVWVQAKSITKAKEDGRKQVDIVFKSPDVPLFAKQFEQLEINNSDLLKSEKVCEEGNEERFAFPFRLGDEGNWRLWVNYYSYEQGILYPPIMKDDVHVNIGLSKTQHIEERERRKNLYAKFSLCDAFTLNCWEWLAPTAYPAQVKGQHVYPGPFDAADFVHTLKLTLAYLEQHLPLGSVSPVWISERKKWFQRLYSATAAEEVAIALLQLEASIRAISFHRNWLNSLGNLDIDRNTVAQRDEDKRLRFLDRSGQQVSGFMTPELLARANREAAEMIPQSVIRTRNPRGVKHSIWKTKGEEYRRLGGDGWSWISATRPLHDPTKPLARPVIWPDNPNLENQGILHGLGWTAMPHYLKSEKATLGPKPSECRGHVVHPITGIPLYMSKPRKNFSLEKQDIYIPAQSGDSFADRDEELNEAHWQISINVSRGLRYGVHYPKIERGSLTQSQLDRLTPAERRRVAFDFDSLLPRRLKEAQKGRDRAVAVRVKLSELRATDQGQKAVCASLENHIAELATKAQDLRAQKARAVKEKQTALAQRRKKMEDERLAVHQQRFGVIKSPVIQRHVMAPAKRPAVPKKMKFKSRNYAMEAEEEVRKSRRSIKKTKRDADFVRDFSEDSDPAFNEQDEEEEDDDDYYASDDEEAFAARYKQEMEIDDSDEELMEREFNIRQLDGALDEDSEDMAYEDEAAVQTAAMHPTPVTDVSVKRPPVSIIRQSPANPTINAQMKVVRDENGGPKLVKLPTGLPPGVRLLSGGSGQLLIKKTTMLPPQPSLPKPPSDEPCAVKPADAEDLEDAEETLPAVPRRPSILRRRPAPLPTLLPKPSAIAGVTGVPGTQPQSGAPSQQRPAISIIRTATSQPAASNLASAIAAKTAQKIATDGYGEQKEKENMAAKVVSRRSLAKKQDLGQIRKESVMARPPFKIIKPVDQGDNRAKPPLSNIMVKKLPQTTAIPPLPPLGEVVVEASYDEAIEKASNELAEIDRQIVELREKLAEEQRVEKSMAEKVAETQRELGQLVKSPAQPHSMTKYPWRDRSALRIPGSKPRRESDVEHLVACPTHLPSLNPYKHRGKWNLFSWHPNNLRSLILAGGRRELRRYDAERKRINQAIWPYPTARPCMAEVWRFHLTRLEPGAERENLAKVALQLRVLWSSLRWLEMHENPLVDLRCLPEKEELSAVGLDNSGLLHFKQPCDASGGFLLRRVIEIEPLDRHWLRANFLLRTTVYKSVSHSLNVRAIAEAVKQARGKEPSRRPPVSAAMSNKSQAGPESGRGRGRPRGRPPKKKLADLGMDDDDDDWHPSGYMNSQLEERKKKGRGRPRKYDYSSEELPDSETDDEDAFATIQDDLPPEPDEDDQIRELIQREPLVYLGELNAELAQKLSDQKLQVRGHQLVSTQDEWVAEEGLNLWELRIFFEKLFPLDNTYPPTDEGLQPASVLNRERQYLALSTDQLNANVLDQQRKALALFRSGESKTCIQPPPSAAAMTELHKRENELKEEFLKSCKAMPPLDDEAIVQKHQNQTAPSKRKHNSDDDFDPSEFEPGLARKSHPASGLDMPYGDPGDVEKNKMRSMAASVAAKASVTARRVKADKAQAQLAATSLMQTIAQRRELLVKLARLEAEEELAAQRQQSQQATEAKTPGTGKRRGPRKKEEPECANSIASVQSPSAGRGKPKRQSKALPLADDFVSSPDRESVPEQKSAKVTPVAKTPKPKAPKAKKTPAKKQQKQAADRAPVVLPVTEEEADDPNKLYCVCRKPYDPLAEYIGCDLCQDWFHFACVGLTPEDTLAIGDSYQCPQCVKKQAAAEETLYCLCKQPYDETRVYIACDNCDDWFHCECVGMSLEEAHAIDGPYVCAKCKEGATSKIGAEGSAACSGPSFVPVLLQDVKIDSVRQQVEDFLEMVRAHAMAWPFLKPYDESKYPIEVLRTIKSPMDFSTISDKLELNEYQNLAELSEDVNLVFSNSRLAHLKNSTEDKCAEILEADLTKVLRAIKDSFKSSTAS